MAKTDQNLSTQAEYARSRKERGLPGGTREAVRKAVDDGRISAFGPDKLVDQALADTQWERNTRTRFSPNAVVPADSRGSSEGTCELSPQMPDSSATTRPDSDPSYAAFRTRREQADAQMAEMNAAKMRGTMLIRADVDRAMFEIGRDIRDRLTSCSQRIASEVAAVSTAEACESILDREHRIVLEMLVVAFREKIGKATTSAN